MHHVLKEMRDALRCGFLHLCFPSSCLFCSEPMDHPGRLLCAACDPLLELIDPSSRCVTCFCELDAAQHRKGLCMSCRVERPLFQRVAASFDYMGPACALVKRLKYGAGSHLAVTCASFLAMQYVNLGWKRLDYIIPVPMPRFRRWWRGYNQSELIAKELGVLLDVPVLCALGRKHGQLRQAQLSLEERQSLKSSHFFLTVDPMLLEDKCIVVIDDVWTTGSTLRCCAEVLTTAYPASLYALTVCRTLRELNLRP